MMPQKKPLFILAGNVSYDNRGSEAIIRGTVKILRHYYSDPSFLCISHFLNEPEFKKQSLEEFDKGIIHKREKLTKKKWTAQGLYRRIQRRVDPTAHKKFTYREMLPSIKEAKAVLSVGGDNYSLDYGIPRRFTDLDDIVMEKKKPIVIWGASVGPFGKIPEYEKYMIDHLKKVTAIFVRESVSFEYLKQNGIIDNVFRTADPAFLMDPSEPKENKPVIEEGGIGINLSPLISFHITNGDYGAWVEIAAKIISRISEYTSRKIYLIPHVARQDLLDNDYFFLQKVISKANCRNNAIALIPPIYNAAEIKWIISKMDVFAGARTHSTIAALSSGVPTLSFAYSIKAKGINKDIFGNQNYCLNPAELRSEIILEKIDDLIDNSSSIKKDLHRKIPEIQKLAFSAGEQLHKITNEG